MGHCGNGKTALINRLCNKSYREGFQKRIMTREIVFEDVSFYPEGRFRIYDTPGTSSS